MKERKLYQPLPFHWIKEEGTSSKSYYVTFDRFSVYVKWNDNGGVGRLTKFGTGRGDIQQWEFDKSYTMQEAMEFMEEKALEILTKHFERVQ